MNYFTKEELIEIAEYCNWEAHDTGHSDFRRNLRIKIQSMIDSYDEYCNHYWIAEYSCHTVSLAKKVKDMINNYSETATPKKDVT